MRKYYSPLANVILYQLVWFGAVLGGQQAVVLLCALLAMHVYLSRGRRQELYVMGACSGIGVLADSLLAHFGFYEFTPTPSGLPIPFWLVLLWLGFCGTLRLGLAYFIKRLPLAIAAAFIGAPLSYIAAGRLGAVSFPYGDVITALVIACTWIALITLFVFIARAVDSAARPHTAEVS